jgi:alkylation response protein AidB-like acyl-CoA dehydrogenase
MAYTLTEDEEMIRAMVADFARDHVSLDAAHERDRHDTFPTELLTAAAGLGLTGMGLDAEEGGAGITPTAFAVVLETLAAVEPSLSAILAVHNGMGLRLLRHASNAVKAAVIPSAVAGAPVAYLATEEAGGSDKTNLTTEAVPHDDGSYLLTGRKTWGLAATGAKHFIVLAEIPGSGPTLLYVAAETPGVALGNVEPTMGLRSAGIRTVYFDDVAVPAENVIGELGGGMTAYKDALCWLQVGVAATIVGAIDGAFKAATKFAEDRVQFGEPVGKYQAVSDGVTNMDLQRAAARALVREAAGALGTEKQAIMAARAKAFTSEMSADMTRQAIRIQGGTGFMREGGTERFARDVRMLWFMGETPQMQRDLLKRELLDIDYSPTP